MAWLSPCSIPIKQSHRRSDWRLAPADRSCQGINAYHELFAAAGALGITVCIASGDHGTADEDSGHWDGKIHVDHPACDDLVLGCGGTQIGNGQDVVWNDGTPFDVNTPGGGGWASGGGISEIFGCTVLPGEREPAGIDRQ